MELRHLRYFVVLAEELHFRRAAEKLSMSQPPLSQTIKQLETEIGAPLFERGRKRHVKLTAAGRVFRESAERILVASEKAKQSAYLTNKGESGMLAIVHSDDYIADFLPDLLYQFSLRYPNVYLDFYQGITTGFPERINRGEVDCAFSTLPLPAAAADYEILSLSPTAIVAVVPDNHPLSKRKKVTLEETINECLFQITGTKTAAFGVKLEQLQVKAGIQIKSRFATDGSQVEMEMVRRGYGITFTTETSVPTGMKGITVLKLDDPDAYLERALVWRKDNTNPALKRFIEVMQEHLELPSH